MSDFAAPSAASPFADLPISSMSAANENIIKKNISAPSAASPFADLPISSIISQCSSIISECSRVIISE